VPLSWLILAGTVALVAAASRAGGEVVVVVAVAVAVAGTVGGGVVVGPAVAAEEVRMTASALVQAEVVQEGSSEY